MKVNKIYCIFLCVVLLQGCVAIGRSGFYIPESKDLYVKNSDLPTFNIISFSASFIKENIFIDKKEQNIKLLLPQMIDKKSHNIDFIFLPFFLFSHCYDCISNEDNFTVEIRGIYTQDFIDNSQIYIKKDNKIYNGQKNTFLFNKNSNINFPYFSFPFKVKDFKNGIIIIKYKNYEERIPIKYKKLFYLYSNHQ